jgi:hypothetical protein
MYDACKYPYVYLQPGEIWGYSFTTILIKNVYYIYIYMYSIFRFTYIYKWRHWSSPHQFQLQELGRWIYVGPTQQRTHFWSCETFLDYLQFLEQELRARRKLLNLPLSEKALVLCDAAAQHSIKKYRAIKERWMQKNNCVPRFKTCKVVLQSGVVVCLSQTCFRGILAAVG